MSISNSLHSIKKKQNKYLCMGGECPSKKLYAIKPLSVRHGLPNYEFLIKEASDITGYCYCFGCPP